MSRPTPIPTAQRALATAIKALESISISTGIKGTAIKLGNEFVTDTNAVLNDLVNVKADAQALVDGLETLLRKLKQSTTPDGPVQRSPMLRSLEEVSAEYPVVLVNGQQRCEAVIDSEPDDDTDGESASYLTPGEFVEAVTTGRYGVTEAKTLDDVLSEAEEAGEEVVIVMSEDDVPALTEHLEKAFAERTPVPELFSATPTF